MSRHAFAGGPARCTCGTRGPLHSIVCMGVAAAQPHAMVNDAGEVFYPDDPDDAAWFAEQHGAYPLTEVLP